MSLVDDIERDVGEVFITDFAEEARYTPAGGTERRVSLIFDRQANVLEIGEMIELDGVAATAHVQTSLVPEIALGDTMIVRGTLYKVVGNEPDGTGKTMLLLGI